MAHVHGSVGLGERSKKFNEKDFKRWQQKMFFYLTTLNLARFMQEDAPDLGDNPDRQTVAAVDAWKHSDFLCKNYILNGLDNVLYNVYSPMVNAKALWESLKRKYKTEDAGSKKFIVGKFLDFNMVDSKTVISQVQEFQLILHDIHAEGMVLGESFQVAALIKKISPTWRDFKNYLKHKRKEMKLEDLIVKLRIKEDNRQSEKKVGEHLDLYQRSEFTDPGIATAENRETVRMASASSPPSKKQEKQDLVGWNGSKGGMTRFSRHVFRKIMSRHLQNPLPLPRLNGKTCIVIGSTSGIGLEIARQLAESGTHVVMAVRNPIAANELIRGRTGGPIRTP
ncbi:hypothetical protein RJ639_019684 [Escallonia herrerae]|uniref:Uncharacterized protein n=1 Tax=Escallonia herrerae TaxID=1293975 RepID=A0AA88VD26_9ASTE|nr:hypothetical protein RJ639_019684 [Escallonia herrerae]